VQEAKQDVIDRELLSDLVEHAQRRGSLLGRSRRLGDMLSVSFAAFRRVILAEMDGLTGNYDASLTGGLCTDMPPGTATNRTPRSTSL